MADRDDPPLKPPANAEREARRAKRQAGMSIAPEGDDAPTKGEAERAERRARREAERQARRAERQAAKDRANGAKRKDRGAEAEATLPTGEPSVRREAGVGRKNKAEEVAVGGPVGHASLRKGRAGKRPEKVASKQKGAPRPRSATPTKSISESFPAQAAGARRDQNHPAEPRSTRAQEQAAPATPPFDILVVAQRGGIDRQAAILAASLRRNAPSFQGRLIVAEPQPEGAWSGTDPRMSPEARAAIHAFGAEIRPLIARDFGRSYPYGNKIEALALLDAGRPFLFLDSDTLILDDIGAVPFDFTRPAASMRREGSWPQPPAYRQTYDSIWRSLYDRFGLDMVGSLDLTQPDEHWERFLYFNAGWFFGMDPAEFGRRFRDWAVAVRDDPGEALACQSLDPWLDQVVLPLVIHSLGGGRPGPELAGMDGEVTWHYRNLPLLYARGPQRAIDEFEAIAAMPEMAPLVNGWQPAERLIRDGAGRRKIRPMFADYPPLAPERGIRKRLKQAELWFD